MTDEELINEYAGYSDEQLAGLILQGIPDWQKEEFQRLLRLRLWEPYEKIIQDPGQSGKSPTDHSRCALKAKLLDSPGAKANRLVEVTANGVPIGKLNIGKWTVDLLGVNYAVVRSGIISAKYELRYGKVIIATAASKLMSNDITLISDGKAWKCKAIGIFARRFGLYDGEKEVGVVSLGGLFKGMKEITVELPGSLAQAVQIFLLLIVIKKWTDMNY